MEGSGPPGGFYALWNELIDMKSLNLPVDKALELYGLADAVKFFPKLLPHMGTMRRWGRVL